MNYFLIFALLFTMGSVNLPLDSCQNLYADLKKGTLNKVNAAAEMEEVKSKFTCFTGESKEGEFYNCGGGVFFLKHQFFFYTHRDYIEIRDGFPGKFSHKVMGVGKEALILLMDNADKTETYGKDEYLQFKRKWGVLVFVLTNDKVKKIQFHHKKEIGKIEFCY